MKFSLITVCLNSKDHIERAMKSLFSQTYQNNEYIVIDGGSTDGTLDIIERYRDKIDYFVSEPDKGLYDAMNKGIEAATGDVLFFLNSDDYFVDEKVLADVAGVFLNKSNVEVVFGDQVFDWGDKLSVKDQSHDVTREQLAWTTIHHQTIFAKKSLFARAGNFLLEYRIVSDYEWILRVFLHYSCAYAYINRGITVMATSGISWQKAFEEERLKVMKKYFTDAEIFKFRTAPLITKKNELIATLNDLVKTQKDRLAAKDREIKRLQVALVKKSPVAALISLIRGRFSGRN